MGQGQGLGLGAASVPRNQGELWEGPRWERVGAGEVRCVYFPLCMVSGRWVWMGGGAGSGPHSTRARACSLGNGREAAAQGWKIGVWEARTV